MCQYLLTSPSMKDSDGSIKDTQSYRVRLTDLMSIILLVVMLCRWVKVHRRFGEMYSSLFAWFTLETEDENNTFVRNVS
jgi:hypothetical protein